MRGPGRTGDPVARGDPGFLLVAGDPLTQDARE